MKTVFGCEEALDWLPPHLLTPMGIEAAKNLAHNTYSLKTRLEEKCLELTTFKISDILQAQTDIDFESLRMILTTTGWVKRQQKEYKEAMSLLQSISHLPMDLEQQLRLLPQVEECRNMHRELQKMYSKCSERIGPSANSPDTDWLVLLKALQRLANYVEKAPLSANVKTLLQGTVRPDVKDTITAIQQKILSYKPPNGSGMLTPQALPDMKISIARLQEDADAFADLLRKTLHEIENLGSLCTLPVETLRQGNSLIEEARIFCDLQALLKSEELKLKTMLGDDYTNLSQLEKRVRWVIRTKNQFGKDEAEPLSEEHVSVIYRVAPVEENPYAEWKESEEHVIRAFAPSRTADILQELSTIESGLEFLESLRSTPEGQKEWFQYLNSVERLNSYGLSGLLKIAQEKYFQRNTDFTDPLTLPKMIEVNLLQSWVNHVIANTPAVSDLSLSEDHDSLVQRFQELDRELTRRGNAHIIESVERKIHATNFNTDEGNLIRRQAQQKRNHLPVRELFEQAGGTIQILKPIFMMSPLSVSQYLPPGMVFDVVIFDEASQVLPGDAINCIYRGKQLVVVGDSKQLPPTTFFKISDDEEEDFESILGIAEGCGAYKELSLKWHYRSRHEDLISFSNSQFYTNSLLTFPSSNPHGKDSGVELFHVPGGVYKRGKGASNDNMPEAHIVGERVLYHARNRPHMSLGVVAFSASQANAITDVIDELRLKYREVERLVGKEDRMEGFFVKSLESVQGDERDVLIFSVGYGKDEFGKLSQNFGPLNREGGWRRLNVAVTRAKHRNEIVSSITWNDINPGSNESLRHFQMYLKYAAHGVAGLREGVNESKGSPESPFEESVLATVESWGFEAVPQVGSGGYRIDIGVKHPNNNSVYMVGIECDGATYHSSYAARDRDRLRQNILEGLGWNIYRIWSTSWFKHPEKEKARLKKFLNELTQQAPAIETQPEKKLTNNIRTGNFKSLQSDVVEFPEPPTRVENKSNSLLIELDVERFNLQNFKGVKTYVEANADECPVKRNSSRFIDMPVADLAEVVAYIVKTESPIHESLLENRLRKILKLGPLTSKARQHLREAIIYAERLGVERFDPHKDFLVIGDDLQVVARTFHNRTLPQIHPQELAQMLYNLTTYLEPVRQNDLVKAASAVYAFESLAHISFMKRCEDAIDFLFAEELLTLSPEGLIISR